MISVKTNMSKIKAGDCRSFSIFNLKKWGYFTGYRAGNITWTSGWSEIKNSISFLLDIMDSENMYIELNYTTTNNWSKQKKDIKHKYPIVTTPCHYGGVRYWFICSVYKNGEYCGRKVAKLYKGGGSPYFACRHCLDLTYSSRIDGYAYTQPDIDKREEEIKRYCYNGKLTRKYRNLLKMKKTLNKNLIKFLGKYDKL